MSLTMVKLEGKVWKDTVSIVKDDLYLQIWQMNGPGLFCTVLTDWQQKDQQPQRKMSKGMKSHFTEE